MTHYVDVGSGFALCGAHRSPGSGWDSGVAETVESSEVTCPKCVAMLANQVEEFFDGDVVAVHDLRDLRLPLGVFGQDGRVCQPRSAMLVVVEAGTEMRTVVDLRLNSDGTWGASHDMTTLPPGDHAAVIGVVTNAGEVTKIITLRKLP